jgi:predicted protein tyrosine phosphatase
MKINTTEVSIKPQFTVSVMGIKEFEKLMKLNKLNDNNIENVSDTAIISITCGDNSNDMFIANKHGINDEHYFKQNHSNVLNMEFYDIDKEVEINGKVYVPFTTEQANRIIDFIEVNKNKHYIIHCHAGISRSGAVAQFITDFYGWADKSTFRYQYSQRIVPNTEVTKKLKEEWFRRKSKLDSKEYLDMIKTNEIKTVDLKEIKENENN